MAVERDSGLARAAMRELALVVVGEGGGEYKGERVMVSFFGVGVVGIGEV